MLPMEVHEPGLVGMVSHSAVLVAFMRANEEAPFPRVWGPSAGQRGALTVFRLTGAEFDGDEVWHGKFFGQHTAITAADNFPFALRVMPEKEERRIGVAFGLRRAKAFVPRRNLHMCEPQRNFFRPFLLEEKSRSGRQFGLLLFGGRARGVCVRRSREVREADHREGSQPPHARASLSEHARTLSRKEDR